MNQIFVDFTSTITFTNFLIYTLYARLSGYCRYGLSQPLGNANKKLSGKYYVGKYRKFFVLETHEKALPPYLTQSASLK